MSVSVVSLASVNTQNPPPVTQPNSQPTAGQGNASQPKISTARRAVEKVAGAPAALVGSVVNWLPGNVAGGFSAVSSYRHKSDTEGIQGVALALELMAAGGVAGGMTLGPVGAVAGVVAGLVLGILNGVSGAAERVGDKVHDAVTDALKNNAPSGSKVRDLSKNFTEGAIRGGVASVKEGWNVGSEVGEGITSGLLEGTKGVLGAVAGKYNPPQVPQPKEKFSLLSVPKKVLEAAFGLVGGAFGAALSAPDGLLQGLGEGISKEYDGSTGLHRFLSFAETTIAGGVAGGMTFGPIGIAGGAVAGAILGGLIARIEKKSGADKQITDGVARAVKWAASDNAADGRKVYESYRNAVEGAMVGTVAGVREGFKAGFDGGKGVVDGVADVVKGIFDGLFGSSGKKQPAPKTP